MTVSVSYLSKNCTTCLFISKSFKELFFMAFFSKADAKVRTFSELPKLFRRNFQKSFFQPEVHIQSLLQYFNFTAFHTWKLWFKKPPIYFYIEGFIKNGGYLLSNKRSTIGVTRLNFSVRNGKRCNPCAIAT